MIENLLGLRLVRLGHHFFMVICFLVFSGVISAGPSLAQPLRNKVSTKTTPVGGNAKTLGLSEFNDDFARDELGPNWTANGAFEIRDGELVNASPADTWSGFLATCNAVIDPATVELTYGAHSDETGRAFTGLAVMLDDLSESASGYLIFHNYRQLRLFAISGGEVVEEIASADGFSSPESGEVLRVKIKSEQAGHYFQIYNNGQFLTTLSDPQKRFNGVFSGIMINGNTNNSVTSFYCVNPNDTHPPKPVTDLRVVGTSFASVILGWTAPGNNSDFGRAERYDIRYSTDPILSEVAFESATAVANTIPPQFAGETEQLYISGLASGTTYYFALKAIDNAGNVSELSNDASATTTMVVPCKDNFNRDDGNLGEDWSGDLTNIQIHDGAAQNIAVGDIWSTVIFKSCKTVFEATLKYGAEATAHGIGFSGIVLLADNPSTMANGYVIQHFSGADPADPNDDATRLWALQNGRLATVIEEGDSRSGILPGAGTRITARVIVQDGQRYFYVYVNDVFDRVLSDPQNRYNGLYSGFVLESTLGAQNAVDDFTANATPGRPKALSKISGDNQFGSIGQNLPAPLTVALIDSFDNALPNALIKFTVASGTATITPPSKDNNIRLDAEDAAILAPIQRRNDGEASGGKFIVYPIGQTVDAAATFTFTIKQAGVYRIWTRSMKTGNEAGSWSISVDGGTTFVYDVFKGTTANTWVWDLVSDRGNGSQFMPQFNPKLFNFSAGTHTVVFHARWADTRLDKILMTADGNYSPRGKEESGFFTDTNGQAKAPVTLGEKAGVVTIQASHGDLPLVTFTATVTGGAASKLLLTSGANQSGAAGQALQPFRVTVQDNNGNGVGGQLISWVVTNGNGRLSEYTSTSDLSGLASTTLTLGNVSATNTVEARAAFTSTPIAFSATTTSGLASNATVAAGNAQTGAVHAALPSAVVAKVTTATGQPVANFPVDFRVMRGGGALNPNIALNNGGFELAHAGANTPANWNLEGSPAATEVLLSTTAPRAGAKSLQVNSSGDGIGVSQSVNYPAAGNYTLSFYAKVASGVLRVTWRLSDALGNPINKVIDIPAIATGSNWVPYIIVMANGATTTGSLSFKTFGASGLGLPGGAGNFFVDEAKISRNTDSNGEIAVNWTLGDTAMIQTMRAEAKVGNTALSGSPTLFSATATPGAAKKIASVSGNNQDGSPGQVLNAPLIVKVADDFGNGIPNHSVRFTVTAGGGKLNNNAANFTTNTDNKGLAQARWTLGSAAGDTNKVQATSTGLNTVRFVALTAIPSKVTKLPSPPTVGSAGRRLDQPLVVRVTNASGKKISGYPVIFSIRQGNGTINDSTQASIRTDSLGEARAFPVLGPTPGVQNRIDAWINYNGQTLPAPALTFVVTAVRLKRLELVSGNNQTAAAGEALAETFKVKVLDSLGVGIKGQAVTFTVIKGGGKFGADTVKVVSTDAQGIAQIKLALGTKPGINQVTAKAAANLTGSPFTFTATGTVGVATALQKTSGDSLSAIVNTVLPSPLTVRVVDKPGNGIANAKVKFAVKAGGGKLNGKDTLTATTDANGRAQASWQLGSVAGKFNNQVEARAYNGATELDNSPLLFVASALSNAARSMKATGVTSFTGRAGAAASSNLIIKVTDGTGGAGNGVPGHPVQFVVVRGGGLLYNRSADTTVTTDENGLAQVSWTFGGAIGTNSQEVRVTSSGVNGRLQGAPVIFTANVSAGLASAEGSYVQATGPVPADGATPSRVTIYVRDRFGNPLASEGITIVVTPSNNVIDQPATKTDAQGKVTGSFTSRIAGTKTVTAKVLGGIEITRGATVKVTPLAANHIKVSGGNNQTCNVRAAMSQPLVVKVADKFENGVANYPVRFNPQGEGRILETMPVRTDSSGLAKATFIAGSNTGQMQIWVEASGLENSPLIFLANVVNSPPKSLEAMSGNGQIGQVGQDLAEPLVLRVMDNSGRPVNGVPVKFDVTFGGGTIYGQDPFTAQTNELGEAQVTWRLGPSTGPNTLRVESQGLAGSPIDFQAQAGAGAPEMLKIAAGQRASGSVGTTMPQALVVQVTDAGGNGVDNVPVLFELVEGSGSFLAGGSVQVLQVMSTSGGYASVQFTFGEEVGWRTVRANAYGLHGSPAEFSIYGRALAARTMTIIDRTNKQRGTKGKVLNFPLQVLVQDRLGNPVLNDNITFFVIGGGGNFNGSATLEAKTDSNGIASAPWTLGTSLSANEAMATRPGVQPTEIAFQATGFDNNFPIFAEAPDRRVTEGDLIEFTVSATDADGDPIKYTVKNLPLGAQFDSLVTRKFRWATHSNSAEHYEISFFAHDNKGGVDEEIVIIDVKNRNQAPRISSRFPVGFGIPAQPDTTIDLNTSLLMRVEASDPDDDPLNYRWFLDGNFAGSSTNTFLLRSTKTFNNVMVLVFDREDTVSTSWLIKVPVQLSSFSATLENEAASSGQRVNLQWRTESEANNVGFNVLRSRSRDGRYEKINPGLIPARRDGQYTFADVNIEVGIRYFYKLEDVDVNGNVTVHGPVSVEVAAPKSFALQQNYPNPFNPTTQIHYELPKAGQVSLVIYNSLGQEVRRLVEQQLPAGYHDVTWNGRDQHGKPVPSGIYHYRLQVKDAAGRDDYVATKKMLMAK